MNGSSQRRSPKQAPSRYVMVAAAAGVLLLVAGVPAVTSAGTGATPTRLSAVLKASPNQEFPRPRARGSLRAVYSPSTHALKFRLTYSGMSGPVRVGELHIGRITHAGLTGRYPICDVNTVRCVSGKWLTIEQVFPDLMNQLARRGGYIDLHTFKNTAGEAAGKLRLTR